MLSIDSSKCLPNPVENMLDIDTCCSLLRHVFDGSLNYSSITQLVHPIMCPYYKYAVPICSVPEYEHVCGPHICDTGACAV